MSDVVINTSQDERIAELERKLADTVELLHLWRNEAFSYRWLAEGILDGEYEHEEARKLLAVSPKLKR